MLSFSLCDAEKLSVLKPWQPQNIIPASLGSIAFLKVRLVTLENEKVPNLLDIYGISR